MEQAFNKEADMGVGCMSSSDGVSTAPNPDPSKYIPQGIQELFHQNKWYTVFIADYPGCTTYRGRKILVYRGKKDSQLRGLKKIDPHFGLQKLSPCARFAPTGEGYEALKSLVGSIDQHLRDLIWEVSDGT